MLFDRIMRRARRGAAGERPGGAAGTGPVPHEMPEAEAVVRFSAATAWARADTRLLTVLIEGLRREEAP